MCIKNVCAINQNCFYIEIAQARPVLHTSLMQRMTDVLSRMLNDPATRAALSGGGEDSLEGVIDQQSENSQQNVDNSVDAIEETNSNVDEREQQAANNESLNSVENIENNQSINNEPVSETVADSSQSSNQQRFESEQDIPMEDQSSHSEETNFAESSGIPGITESDRATEQNSNQTESSNWLGRS